MPRSRILVGCSGWNYDHCRFVIVEKLGVAGEVADERYTRSDSPRASDQDM